LKVFKEGSGGTNISFSIYGCKIRYYWNLTMELFCRYHAIHKDIYDWFDIDFDKFGRTSTPQQTEICQAIFKVLLEKDRLSQNVMEQVMITLL
jgi:hypothetical protein